MSMTLDGSNGVTFNDSSLQGAAASPYVLKNRIINGAMVIDQRNAGASGSTGGYTVDRWYYDSTQNSKVTWQQNQGSVTPPTGFTNYLGITSSSAYTVLTGDEFRLGQVIEGFNVADLDFGKSTAKTFTLSFWVRSSLTGTFGGSLTNGAATRSYPFSYTISAANTWEQKSITITGDTSGTWLTTNGAGLCLNIGLGVGSTYSGTAGSWASANYISATGATSVVGTNGATFYITGVQLEIGSTATPFERRMYGTELALCQRYYEELTYGTISNGYLITGGVFSASQGEGVLRFSVVKRATPTMGYTGTIQFVKMGGGNLNTLTPAFDGPNIYSCLLYSSGGSGMTAGQVIRINATDGTTKINASAEL